MDHSGGNLTKHRKNIAVLWLLIAIAVLGFLKLEVTMEIKIQSIQDANHNNYMMM